MKSWFFLCEVIFSNLLTLLLPGAKGDGRTVELKIHPYRRGVNLKEWREIYGNTGTAPN